MNGMSANRDPETVLAAWLDEGPLGLPSETRRAILAALPTTSQARRGPFALWRLLPMNGYTRFAAVVGLAALAVAGGLFLIGGGQPGPSPSPSPSLSGIDTTTWVDFTSTRHGYSFRHPSGLTEQPATRDATLADIAGTDPAVWDHFVAGPAATRIIAVSSVVPDGMTPEAWTAAWLETFESGCAPDRATWQPLTVDGYDGFVYSACNFAEWLGFADGRAYAFTVSEPTGSSATTATRDLLVALLSTVQLDPSAAPTPRSVISTAFPRQVSLTVPGSWTQTNDTPDSFAVYESATYRPDIPLVGIGIQVVTNAYRDICDPSQGLLDPPLGSEVQDIVDFLLAAEALHATVVDPDVQLGGPLGMSGIALEEAFAPPEGCRDPMALWPIGGEPYGNFASERSRFYVIGDETHRFVVQILATDGIWQTQLSTAEAALETLRFE